MANNNCWHMLQCYALCGVAFTLFCGCSDAAATNPIIIENEQPGDPGWQVTHQTPSLGNRILGFTSQPSVNKGESLLLYVSVDPVQDFDVDIYRLGWYDGMGGRRMSSRHITLADAISQPDCLQATDNTGLLECSNWTKPINIQTEESWTSGIYIAKLSKKLSNTNTLQSQVLFVVRDDYNPGDFLYQQPIFTYAAYNNFPDAKDRHLGKSLYETSSYGPKTIVNGRRAVKVSLDRPNLYRHFEFWEINLVRWLEKNGYHVNYATDLDTHLHPERLLKYRGFISAGHNEYWTHDMFTGVKRARNQGLNLAFFGANVANWQIRLAASKISKQANRILICYKDMFYSKDNRWLQQLDPYWHTQNGSGVTLKPGSIADRRQLITTQFRMLPKPMPEQTLTGIQYGIWNLDKPEFLTPFVVNDADFWVYAGTDLNNGDQIPHLIGYEIDYEFENYAKPKHVVEYHVIGRSPFESNNTSPGSVRNAQAETVIFRVLNQITLIPGAWVFASGTMSWERALDETNADYYHPAVAIITRNILERFLVNE